ncbi:MAG: hypothetical protein HGB04_04850 [Chlorobiaceae bacterium]|nr:hypothetical protein [Chlorobiaceae bacterium]
MVLRRQVGRATLLLFAVTAFRAAPARADFTADSNAIHAGPCSRPAAGRLVTLEIDPKPVRHMQELTFMITIAPSDGLPSNLLLDLSMPGMAMGRNQVRMTRMNAGIWEGKGLIVRCMSGRTLWRATLLSNELGNPSFTFNVRN